jgi:hypothetical protein
MMDADSDRFEAVILCPRRLPIMATSPCRLSHMSATVRLRLLTFWAVMSVLHVMPRAVRYLQVFHA